MLQSAKHVFAHSTYADASTGELARASEVTEPMLYKHFGSKKGLFLAVLCEFGAQFFDLLQERVSRRAEQNVLDALAHVVDDYCTTIKTDPETQRVLFQAINNSGDPDIALCVRESNQAVYGLIHELVERALAQGYLDASISPDAATWGYMSMILAIQYGLMLNLSAEVAQVQVEMSHIWLRGLRSH
jgi:AcrR family transcriptional regulator